MQSESRNQYNSKSSHMLVQVFGEQNVSVWRTLGHREVHRKNPRGQVPQQGEGELLVAEMKKTGLGFSVSGLR